MHTDYLDKLRYKNALINLLCRHTDYDADADDEDGDGNQGTGILTFIYYTDLW